LEDPPHPMKHTLPLALILGLALTGCSSLQAPKEAPATDLGLRQTQWGELHAFTQASAPRWKNGRLKPEPRSKDSRTVLHLLVTPKGIVQDSSVLESSGDKEADEAARATWVGASFPEMPDRHSTEPYVIQVVTVLKAGTPDAPPQYSN